VEDAKLLQRMAIVRRGKKSETVGKMVYDGTKNPEGENIAEGGVLYGGPDLTTQPKHHGGEGWGDYRNPQQKKAGKKGSGKTRKKRGGGKGCGLMF